MKNIIKFFLSTLLLFNVSFAFAANIDHFIVEFNKDQAEVWEAIDLTIKAVDQNDEIIRDYTWNIFWVSITDEQAELPNDLTNDEWYTFQLSDQWVKKFENWVVFNTPWEQSISIYDSSDYENITWEWTIKIVPASEKKQNEEIEIITPENNTTLADKNVKISWQTKKNHQVQIEINNNQKITTISNSNWIFEKDVELQTWKNTIKAYILDADDNIIWESPEVIVMIDNNLPKFKKILLSPVSESWSVEAWTIVDVSVYATSKLKKVNVVFNDSIIELSETEDWIYTWSFKAPNEEKLFPIDVNLANDLGHTLNKKNVANLYVYLPEQNAAPAEEQKEELTCSWITDPNLLKVTWLKLVKLKTKSILTWYENKYAESYNIYEKNKDWEFEFIKNVKEPKFEVEITWDKIKYSYFAVRAKTKWCNSEWKETELLWDYSDATKIQTWPTLIILLFISLLLWGSFMYINRKKI